MSRQYLVLKSLRHPSLESTRLLEEDQLLPASEDLGLADNVVAGEGEFALVDQEQGGQLLGPLTLVRFTLVPPLGQRK